MRAQRRGQLFLEAAAVGQLGDGVDPRHAVDRAGGVATLGDVLNDDDGAFAVHAVNGDLDCAIVERLERGDDVDAVARAGQRDPDALDFLAARRFARDSLRTTARRLRAGPTRLRAQAGTDLRI